MPTATATGFTSSLSGLPDQVLLAHTRSLVLHEQALQLAVLDHLREIHARHLLRQRAQRDRHRRRRWTRRSGRSWWRRRAARARAK